MSIFKEPPKTKMPNMKLDDDQKRELGESKWIFVIISTIVCFVVGGGWRLVWPGAITEHFNTAVNAASQASQASQATAWLQFSLFFGFVPALGGFIITAALIDYLSHSKGNR